MRNDLATDLSRERHVVEVDGIANFRESAESKFEAQARASELSR